mmetsp:Transcript_11594/g.46853  ORF Transcript_11594/g.46853 Transcript_11594/m.46853 type:complete len:225 (-) Transcript_11594:1807-2481(-)
MGVPKPGEEMAVMTLKLPVLELDAFMQPSNCTSTCLVHWWMASIVRISLRRSWAVCHLSWVAAQSRLKSAMAWRASLARGMSAMPSLERGRTTILSKSFAQRSTPSLRPRGSTSRKGLLLSSTESSPTSRMAPRTARFTLPPRSFRLLISLKIFGLTSVESVKVLIRRSGNGIMPPTVDDTVGPPAGAAEPGPPRVVSGSKLTSRALAFSATVAWSCLTSAREW